MRNSFHRRRPASWPFWLLLTAWACANTPAIAVCALLTWLGEARHFSHQQRLVTDVAFVLTGHQAPGLGVMAAVKHVEQSTPRPAATVGVELKKLDLAVERVLEVRLPSARENNFAPDEMTRHDAQRAAPPHEPPRATAIA